jgi:hypothetical protein
MDQKPGKTQSLEEASLAAATARHKIVTAWTSLKRKLLPNPKQAGTSAFQC